MIDYAPMNDASRGWRFYTLQIWLLLVALVCAASVLGHMAIGLNNDSLDLLDQVRKMLAGGIPYVAYSDVDPPLIHLLYILPVLLAKWTPLLLSSCVYLFTYAIIVLALVVSAAVLKYSGASSATRSLLLSALALALVTVSFIHQAFADRDHLTITLIMPWLVLYSPLAKRSDIPAGWRLAAALMAAIGLAIKPNYCIFYVFCMGFVVCFERPLHRVLREWEHYVIAAFAVLYIAVVSLFFREYLTGVLPLAWATYAAQCWTWESKQAIILSQLLGEFAVLPVAEAALLLVAAPALFDKTLSYLFFLLAAGLASYSINGGWYYTQYPFIAVALVLSIVLGARLLALTDTIRPGSLRRLCRLVLICALVAGLGYYFVKPISWRAAMDIQAQRDHGHPWENLDITPAARQKIDARLTTHPRFIFLTLLERSVDLLEPGTPRQNVGRYDYLWPLPGLLKLEKNEDRRQDFQVLSNYFIDGIADDINNNAPAMILVDTSREQFAIPDNFDIVGWMKKFPRFDQAWHHYTRVDRINACTPGIQSLCAFDVYYRK